MTAAEKSAIPVQGYGGNAEFLEAKFNEVLLLLECAALRQRLDGRSRRRWLEGLRAEPDVELPSESLQKRLDLAERELLQRRAIVDARLAESDPAVVPFLGLVDSCELSDLDERILWLLFFKAVSPEFRATYDQLGLHRFGDENDEEICIGNLLQVLCGVGITGALRARQRFSVEAPLMAHHLIRPAAFSHTRPSILEVEVHLPQRVVAWVSGDDNRYLSDSPCLVEWPTEAIVQVILDNGLLERVLRVVDHHQDLQARRVELGLDIGISYGTGLTILEYGPSGTGKTLLARALARRCGQPLVSLTAGGSEGTDAADLEYLFREARLQGGIVFIDECESLCGQESDELRCLLRELEQFDGIVIMATNQPQELVPQLDRRFTLKVPFSMPSAASRERIWALHLGDVPLAGDVDLAALAEAYPIPGGYIKNAAQTAISEALGQEGQPILCQADLDAACRLQEQRVGRGLTWGKRYHPTVRLEDLMVSDDVRSRLERLATALPRREALLTDWELDAGVAAAPVRVLFHSPDLSAAQAAAEAVAARLGCGLVDFPSRPLILALQDTRSEISPRDLFRSAARVGRIVLVRDGSWWQPNAEAARAELRELLETASPERSTIFVVSAVRTPGRDWVGLFHETVAVTVGDAETRAWQWRKLLGHQADGLDLRRLAADHVLTPSQMRAALQRAALCAAGTGEGSLTDALLTEAVVNVVGRRADRLLFGQPDAAGAP